MSVKPPTEEQFHQRPLLPYENAKVRLMMQGWDRLKWLWSMFRIGVMFGGIALPFFLLLKQQLFGGE